EPRRLVREGGGGPRPPADGGGGHPRVLREGGRARARAPAVPGGPRELLDGPRTVQRSGAVLQQGGGRGPGERRVLLVRVRGELPGEGARRDGEVPRRQDEGYDRAEGALVRAESDRPHEGRREASPSVTGTRLSGPRGLLADHTIRAITAFFGGSRASARR